LDDYARRRFQFDSIEVRHLNDALDEDNSN